MIYSFNTRNNTFPSTVLGWILTTSDGLLLELLLLLAGSLFFRPVWVLAHDSARIASLVYTGSLLLQFCFSNPTIPEGHFLITLH